MEHLFLAVMFILALAIIVNRVRKLFASGCSDCNGECSCCTLPIPQSRRIVEDENGKE